jgi:hypothetical protein
MLTSSLIMQRRAELRAGTATYLQQVRELAEKQDIPGLIVCLANGGPHSSKVYNNGADQKQASITKPV